MATNRLKARQVETLKPGGSIPDGQGLSLVAHSSGTKTWVLRFREKGRLKRLALGKYPSVGLGDARKKRDEILKQLAAGQSPTRLRKAAKQSDKITFADIAADFLQLMEQNHEVDGKPSRSTIDTTKWKLDRASKLFGTIPVDQITTKVVGDAVDKIAAAGKREAAIKILGGISQVMRFAAKKGLVQGDPAGLLRGTLPKPKTKSRVAPTDAPNLRDLLLDIWGYDSLVTRSALQLCFYTAARPGEVRMMMWSELDFEQNNWTLPRVTTKTRRLRIIALSRQAISVLKDLRALRDLEGSKYVLPSLRGKTDYLSEGAMIAALRSLGWSKDEFTPHGARVCFKSLMENTGKDRFLVELCLGHIHEKPSSSVYNVGNDYLEARRPLMQEWADMLDAIRTKR